MVRKQVLRAREHSKESLLEKVKSGSGQKKLTLNNTYYPGFQHVRNLSQELHILLTPDQEHRKVLLDIPVVGLCDGKSLKDYLVRAKLPNVEITGRSESSGKGNCQVCYFICDTDTFITKACGETFKIQSGILSCNSQKVIYLLKCRICGEVSYVGKKAKRNLEQDLIIIEVHTGPIEKNVKYHNSVFMIIMGNTAIMELMIGSLH